MLEPEEIEIIDYLKSQHGAFVSAKEISRRVGGKQRYAEEPHWPRPFLLRMVAKGLIETNETGQYRYASKEAKAKQKRWVSPRIAAILRKSGKKFELLDEGGS